MYSFVEHNGLHINKDFFDLLNDAGLADFQTLKNHESGDIFKKTRFRSVARIGIKDKIFYLKRHFWPLKEKIRSMTQVSKKEDAANEWNNLLLLESLGIKTLTPVAFGEEKRFGIPVCSLTLTENLYDAEKLETYIPANFRPPLDRVMLETKRSLIKKLALFSADFHGKGLNHQDFYLGHIYIRPSDGSLLVIDVQRLHKNSRISMHDRIKDLAQLAYSCRQLAVFTRTDFMRFLRSYFAKDRLDKDDRLLISRITAKVERIARHDAKLQLRKKKR